MRFSISMLSLLLPLSAGAAEGQSASFNPTAMEGGSAGNAGAVFQPDISLILSGTATHLGNDPEDYAIPGFLPGAETGPGTRGLSLGESELIISANVDDLFHGQFTAALTPENEMEVEEAYVQTLGLAHGLSLRAGRFFSGIGYLNGQHPHAWDFVDPPLAYRALLANQYGDDGVRLSWVAPADLFVEFGGEWLRGENDPAAGAANDGQGAATLFAHLGGDVGASHAWRAGLSYLRARAAGRESGALDTAPDAFSGDSRVAVADLVWKWSPDGNPRQTNFKFQAEYLWREEDGVFTADVNGVAPVADSYRATHSGWYAQAVYQFMPQWRAGLRYDQLRAQEIAAGANSALFDTQGHTPRRASLMLDWSRSEFSRLRLQLSRDRSQPDADNQVFVQYIMSLGAHGAHSF